MREKFTDNNIDQTFKEAIDPLETQPSEKFWTEASDSILERANNSYIRKVHLWRMTSLALAAMLICFVFYTFYTSNKVNSIQKQLTSLEKQQVSVNSKAETNEKNKSVSVSSADENALNRHNANQSPAGNQNTLQTQNSSQNNAANNTGELNSGLSTNAIAQENINTTGAVQSEQTSNVPPVSPVKTNSIAPSSSLPSEAIASENPGLPNSAPANAANPDLSSASQPSPMASRTVSAISFPVAGDAKIDAAKSSWVRTFFSPANPVSQSARFSIGIFIAPSANGEFNNSANGNLYSNSATGGEKAKMAFDVGVNLDYAISRKWVIESGLGYHTYSFSMQPTLVWAKPTSQGQLGYSIVTSCGVIQFPYQDPDLKQGDKVHANGNAYCGYLSIPLEIKYNLVTGKRVGLYVTGGAIANLTIVKGAFIHWENTTENDNESIHSIQGLSKAQYSLSVGAGIKYFLGKGFSIFGEPFMNGSATPIDKNVPVISYPYFVGMRVGLFYDL